LYKLLFREKEREKRRENLTVLNIKVYLVMIISTSNLLLFITLKNFSDLHGVCIYSRLECEKRSRFLISIVEQFVYRQGWLIINA